MILHTNRLKLVSLTYDELVEYVKEQRGFIKDDDAENKVWDYTVLPMSNAPESDHLFYTVWCGIYEGKDILQCGFLRPVNENGVVEIWIEVDKDYMNLGFGAEAMNGLIEWANSFKEILFVGASVDIDNYASKRMVTKCGFEYGGEYKGVDVYFLKF